MKPRQKQQPKYSPARISLTAAFAASLSAANACLAMIIALCTRGRSADSDATAAAVGAVPDAVRHGWEATAESGRVSAADESCRWAGSSEVGACL